MNSLTEYFETKNTSIGADNC